MTSATYLTGLRRRPAAESARRTRSRRRSYRARRPKPCWIDVPTNFRYEAAEGPGGYVACTAGGLGEIPHRAHVGRRRHLSVAEDVHRARNGLHRGRHGGLRARHLRGRAARACAAGAARWTTPAPSSARTRSPGWPRPMFFIVVVFTNCRLPGDDSTSRSPGRMPPTCFIPNRYGGSTGGVSPVSDAGAGGPLLGGYGAPYSPAGFDSTASRSSLTTATATSSFSQREPVRVLQLPFRPRTSNIYPGFDIG